MFGYKLCLQSNKENRIERLFFKVQLNKLGLNDDTLKIAVTKSKYLCKITKKIQIFENNEQLYFREFCANRLN